MYVLILVTYIKFFGHLIQSKKLYIRTHNCFSQETDMYFPKDESKHHTGFHHGIKVHSSIKSDLHNLHQ